MSISQELRDVLARLDAALLERTPLLEHQRLHFAEWKRTGARPSITEYGDIKGRLDLNGQLIQTLRERADLPKKDAANQNAPPVVAGRAPATSQPSRRP